jgi:hypothetical protein
MADGDRREKIAFIKEETLCDILNWCHNPKFFLSLPVTEEIPDGTVVAGVWFDHSRGALGLRLQHPSFPLVQRYGFSPEMNTELKIVHRYLRRNEEIKPTSITADNNLE